MQVKFIAALLSIFAFSFTAMGADPKAPQDPKMAEMMQKMTAAATPGDQHKMLAGYVGDFNYTSKGWEKAGGTPHESKGKSKFTMILGGRWLQQEVTGEMMGMPFNGLGFVGYNNMTKQYETVWFDSMGTGHMEGKGTYNASTKTMTDKGEYSCPMKDGEMRSYRGEWKFVDKNKLVYTMYGPGLDDPKEYKMMEIVYTRAK